MQSDDSEGHDGRPAMPPRPLRLSGEDISRSTTLTSPHDVDPLIKRKRVGSGLSKKTWTKQSYEPIELKQVESGDSFSKLSGDDYPSKDMPQPKAFHKTHRYWGLDLGYWRMPVRHFSIFAVLFLIVFLPLWFVVQGHLSTGNADMPFEYDCYGDGSWTFVGISLRFGKFDYGSAKVLDLAWNWIVGRGLQGVLTLLAYRVFSDALLRTAELTPISFELYASLGLYSTKPELLWQLLKGLPKFGNWRVKLILIWLFISTIYLVSFQVPMGTGNSSIVSVQTACVAWYQPETESSDSSTRSLEKAVNLTFYIYPPDNYSVHTYTPYNTEDYPLPIKQCINFSQSRANVSGYYQAVDSQTYLYSWTNPIMNASWWDYFYQYPSRSDYYYWADWGFYPSNKSNFFCNTKTNEYQWGFSYEWLFVVSIVNSIWIIGLWILWVDCDTNSEFCRKGRRLGLWRAIADISEAMREELGPNICAYSEAELAEALKNKSPVKYYSRKGTETEPGHIGLSSRPSGRLRLRWDHQYGEKSQ